VIDEAELRRMSRSERARLARMLARVDDRSRMPRVAGDWRRRLLIAAALLCALALAAWIGVLVVTLPGHYRAGGWSAAWVGFDGALLFAFAATAWAAWRRRQVLILCLVVLATLLACDAWFDTALDYATRGFTLSLLLALLVELPLALMALMGARRLLRLTFSRLDALQGDSGPVPPFWKVPLFGDYSAGDGYRDLFRPPRAHLDEAAPDPGGRAA
jgi:cation transport ATPase